VNPSSAAEGQPVTVQVTVQNNGSTQINNVLPASQAVTPYAGAQGSLSTTAGPLPATPALLLPASSVAYTFTYLATACGDAGLVLSASGTEEGSGDTVAASGPLVTVPVYCLTPTPSPTPWIIYETATPAPAVSEASVRGNVFRPGGPPVEFDVALSENSNLVIRIFDRNGKVIRRIDKLLTAGRYTESWDGRTDLGDLAATGIYIVHFQGKGLNQRAKIAFIK
jgi:hypothetical protein